MSGRDRLAADLHDEYLGIHDIACETQPDEPCDCADTFAIQLADRLIALGWTRLDPSRRLFDLHDEDDFRWLADYFSGYHGVPGLRAATFPDEERLARALTSEAALLRKALDDPDIMPIAAAAIAKAYREDTDADN